MSTTAIMMGLSLLLAYVPCVNMQTRLHFRSALEKECAATNHASGTFEVKLVPQDNDTSGHPSILRMLFDKQFHGDLEATSHGLMMAVGTGEKGSSGGYVAMERVTGKLHGRSGTFALQHSGTMTRGLQQLTVTVVPDSGTDKLAGLSGAMTITIVDGKHFYAFEYTLAG